MAKMSGAELVCRALADAGVRYTFGIPGTHNIELYDALERCETIRPVLVTDEQSASFMADGVSRSSGQIGVVNLVPGAGLTHALSGIAEAYLDQIPMLVLVCGIRRDTTRRYQLHDVEQREIARPVTKAAFLVEDAAEIYARISEAIAVARAAPSGPVLVEIPAHLYLFRHEAKGGFPVAAVPQPPAPSEADLDRVLAILRRHAGRIGLYLGNGCRQASDLAVPLAEALEAPVATTIQGKGVFPETHPLWAWCGIGDAAPPFVQRAFASVKCLLAIGCRFGEVATASYGFRIPQSLVHVDVDAEVFHKNYRAEQTVLSDARAFIEALLPRLDRRDPDLPLRERLREGHDELQKRWSRTTSEERVTPARLFQCLQTLSGPDAIYVADSGNGTFLAMEHLRLSSPGCFLAPIDYSCMGYSLPASLGAKLANPDRIVVSLTGDGAFLMTGLELLTASHMGIAPLVCVLRDEELGQIALFQRAAMDTDTCSILAPYDLSSLCRAVHVDHLALERDSDAERVLGAALAQVRNGHPVVVEVRIDYSQKTFFSRGVLKTNLLRLPLGDRLRMVARVVKRRIW